MNAQSDINHSAQNDFQGDVNSRMEARWQRREARHQERGKSTGGAWIGGAFFILLGVAILMQNFGGFNLDKWWALFILFPAAGAFGNALRAYRAAGHLSSEARGSMIAGFILSMVTAAILFNLNWALIGPVMIIIVGMGVLLNSKFVG